MNSANSIEFIRPASVPRRFRAVVFDWDGTLSLLREGWAAIMTEQMLDGLCAAGIGPSERDSGLIESIVVGMNGQPTIVQMQAFAEAVRRRGGAAIDPDIQLSEYHRRLMSLVQDRYDSIRNGRAQPSEWTMPGARAFLERLRSQNLPVIVLSGTSKDQIQKEADLLDLSPLVDDWHAPIGDDPSFSKRHALEKVLRDRGVNGDNLLAFGDGVVETETVKQLGGFTVAVAGQEPPARGVNSAKRERLIRAGADAVIADFEAYDQWLPLLIAEA